MTPSAKLNPASKLRFFQRAAVVLLLWSTAQAADWVGTADSNLDNGQNWRNNLHGPVMAAPPHAGTKNATTLSVVNGSGFPLGYTESNGATEFNEGLLIGAKNGPSGELKVTGGTLTVEGAIIGQTVEGKLTIFGGTVNLLGGSKDSAIPGCDAQWSVYLGNENTGSGLLTISGGEFRVENGIEIGRNGGSGIVAISGNGRFTCGGPILFPGGSGKASIILGGGTFEQSKNEEILFLSDSNKGWFTFKKGSRGKISLCGRDKAYFDALVKDGRIRIDDLPTTPDHFTFKQNAHQGELHLAH